MTEAATTHGASTDAVILVGGRGTRLRPLTIGTPKPMLPTANYPFLQHLLARIKAAGIEHVVMSTSIRPRSLRSTLVMAPIWAWRSSTWWKRPVSYTHLRAHET